MAFRGVGRDQLQAGSVLHSLRQAGLRAFGSAPAAPAPPPPPPPAAPAAAPPPFETPRNPEVTPRPVLHSPIRSLCVAPMVVFIATSGAFAVCPPLVAFVIGMVCLLRALPVSMPASYVKAGAVSKGALMPVGILLWAVVSGAMTGVYAHESHMGPYFAMALGRQYDNVLASSPGAAYADAGKIRFADTSILRPEFALGYRIEPTYCVAPVLDTGASQTRTAAFWAIGLDCCDARGSFKCGQGNGRARGGARAAPDGVFMQSHQEFLLAIAQAALVSDLVVDEEPILLHWVENATAEQTAQLFGALGVLGLGTCIFALAALGALAVNALQETGARSGGRPGPSLRLLP